MTADGIKEIVVNSSIDSSPEKSLLHLPDTKEKIPLVVGLHTWSAEWHHVIEQYNAFLPFCRERGWALLTPQFRGSNLDSNPRATQACGSRLAKQDIIDALDWTLKQCPIDEQNIFLLGGSGGGHMSLMMAAYAPARFRAISSWCPITDLAAWHAENKNYASHVEKCCGGKPGANPDVDREYRERSPLFHAAAMTGANLSIHHGRFDKSVPYAHTVKLAVELEKLGAKNLFFEIFDGSHELRHDIAFQWFDKLAKPDIKAEKQLSR